MNENELDINYEWSIDINEFDTSGGELHIGDYVDDAYSLDFCGGKKSVSINDIPAEAMKEICSKIFSHLSTNGHVANITEQHQDSYDLVWKET